MEKCAIGSPSTCNVAGPTEPLLDKPLNVGLSFRCLDFIDP